MSDAVLILTNLPDAPSAQALARQLVERKLAACVNILPAVQAVYRWQGVVEQASEVTLLIKSVPSRYAELESAIKAVHPYVLPEIIALPIVAGLPAYLDWITAETQKDVNV
ncbi:divalent-cation tolerance protein CutA [Collimonas sp.]|jgi:periplasmic divalent cation tolerance protein|uniref:divalent-cation tolerance protein CutA n=1 Tax=Collimonas sp. TaxID=1963772 RepID=UPI002C38A0D7|nr:divalent-cation tolerance protein CutA [Collimonas sp.]HWW06865.1 divalent-cation tolerance protein CutA [Collimonas sp.]